MEMNTFNATLVIHKIQRLFELQIHSFLNGARCSGRLLLLEPEFATSSYYDGSSQSIILIFLFWDEGVMRNFFGVT